MKYTATVHVPDRFRPETARAYLTLIADHIKPQRANEKPGAGKQNRRPAKAA